MESPNSARLACFTSNVAFFSHDFIMCVCMFFWEAGTILLSDFYFLIFFLVGRKFLISRVVEVLTSIANVLVQSAVGFM